MKHAELRSSGETGEAIRITFVQTNGGDVGARLVKMLAEQVQWKTVPPTSFCPQYGRKVGRYAAYIYQKAAFLKFYVTTRP